MGIELVKNSGSLDFSAVEIDPTVSDWAKAPTKPSYTPAEVGAETIGAVNAHNTNSTAHSVLFSGVFQAIQALSAAINNKQDILTIDTAFNELSNNVATSKAIADYVVDKYINKDNIEKAVVKDSEKIATSGAVYSAIQDALIIDSEVLL